MRGDGNTGTTGRLGVGTRDPQHPLHVVGTGKHVFENSSDEGTTSGMGRKPTGNVTMGRVEAGRETIFGAVAGRDSYLALSTSQDGVTGERVRIDSAGRMRLHRRPATLDVAGVVRARVLRRNGRQLCRFFRTRPAGARSKRCVLRRGECGHQRRATRRKTPSQWARTHRWGWTAAFPRPRTKVSFANIFKPRKDHPILTSRPQAMKTLLFGMESQRGRQHVH